MGQIAIHYQSAPHLAHSPLGAKVGIHKGETSEFLLVDAAHHIVRNWRQYGFLFGEFGVKVQRILGAPLEWQN